MPHIPGHKSEKELERERLKKERAIERSQARGISLREREELERARARRAGEPTPSLVGERIVTDPLLAEEEARRKRQEERQAGEERVTEALGERPEEEQAFVEETQIDPITGEQFVIDPQTGERQTLLGGGVTPLTASDVTTVLSLGAGGIITGIGKGAAKKGLAVSSEKLFAKVAQKKVGEVITKKTTKTVTQGSLLSRLWATKVGKAILITGGVQTILDGAISAFDTTNSQYRETVSILVAGARNDPPKAGEQLEKLGEMRDDLNRNLRTIKLLGIFSLRAKLGKVQAAQARVDKINEAIDTAITDILLIAQVGQTPDQEDLAVSLSGIEGDETNE